MAGLYNIQRLRLTVFNNFEEYRICFCVREISKYMFTFSLDSRTTVRSCSHNASALTPGFSQHGNTRAGSQYMGNGNWSNLFEKLTF